VNGFALRTAARYGFADAELMSSLLPEPPSPAPGLQANACSSLPAADQNL
jgi:hypothetical protein